MTEKSLLDDSVVSISRRGGLVAGLKFALAAPAVIAALHAPASVYACGGGNGGGDDEGDDDDNSCQASQNASFNDDDLDCNDDERPQVANFNCVLNTTLQKVETVNTSLSAGACKVFSTENEVRKVFIVMKGAPRHTDFRVVFLGPRSNSHVLAAFRTDNSGNCRQVLDVVHTVRLPVANNTVQGYCVVQAKVREQFETHFICNNS